MRQPLPVIPGKRVIPGSQARFSEQPRGFNLLRLPGLRRFLRWRYARLVFQLPLLLLAIMMIIDGFTGRQLAPRNLATTASWLHYRGLVVIALALIGNAFCAACPLMLTRGPSRWLRKLLPARLELRWPRALQGKLVVIVLLLLFFFSYEYFDLWASPWLTAWLAVGYFGAALLVDTLFPAGTFCRYVCPLGNFNFTLATASPTQITAVDHDICRSCEHKPCLHGRESHADASQARGEAAFIPLDSIVNSNGAGFFPGCETGLMAPTIQSNMDCTSCFNCIRACPYDNVALTVRSPVREAVQGLWRRRGHLSFMLLGIFLALMGLLNAAAMVAPFYELADLAAGLLGTDSELLLLVLLFGGTTVLGLGVIMLVTSLADLAGGVRSSPWQALERWGQVVIIVGIGFWSAHYVFHFLTGALQIIPVFGHFFYFRGLAGPPDWQLARLVPTRYLFTVTASITTLYTLLAFTAGIRIALRDFGRRGVLAMWPILLFIIAFAALALWLLGQPMEMRGTLLAPLP
jgi:polyferredoxin